MQIPIIIRSRPNFLPGGKPRIDWRNPITNGLTGCYIPAASPGSVIYNLVGVGSNLVKQSSSTYALTQEGIGLASSASSNGAVANASKAFQPPSTASIFWRGIAPGIVSSNFISVMGVLTNGVNFEYAIYFLGTNTVNLGWNSGGTNPAIGTGYTGSNSIIDFGGTFQQGGNAILYKNGLQVNSGSFGSNPISYPGTPTVNFTGTGGSALGATGLIGLSWNRVLTAQENLLLHLNPYQFLIYPQDQIFAEMIGVSTIATHQTHRHGVAG